MRKLVILIVTLLLVGCVKEPIKIGYSNTLTGSNASFGVETMYGVQLAVHEINENGGINGHQIELIIKDDLADPDTAVKVDNELIAEGVPVIIGHGISSLAERTINNIQGKDVVMLSPTVSTKTYTGIPDNFVRIIPSNDTQGEVLCQFVSELRDIDSITVIAEQRNIAYSSEVRVAFNQCVLEKGISVIKYLPYYTGDSSEIIRLAEELESDPSDVQVMIAPSSDVISLQYYLSQIELKQDVFLSTWGTTSDILSMGANKSGLIYGVSYYHLDNTNPNFLELKNTYEDKYGKDISFAVLFGYETMMVLAEAMETSKSFDPSDILESLIDREYEGIMDMIFIDEFGDSTRKMYELILENGLFEIDHENNN
jgi:branched-chain amino acid transport system substrate-binding protein